MKNVKYDQFRAKDDLKNLTPVVQSFATTYTTSIKHGNDSTDENGDASGIKGEFKAVANQLLKKRKPPKIVYSGKVSNQLERTVQVLVGKKTASNFEV